MQIGAKACLLAAVAVLLSMGQAQAATNYTDVDILNFALNLECLEAEFYSWAAYGEGIAAVDSSLVGTGSALTATNSGGGAVPASFDASVLAIVTEIAENEIAHVRFLRSALGSSAVACPALSLTQDTFTAAATAAVTAAGTSLNPSTQVFNPYTQGADAFLLAAYIFEDVGVTAYKGAVQNLQNSTYASAAAGIMAIEAGHAAVIRDLLYNANAANANTGLTVGTPSSTLSIPDAVKGINALRDQLGGTSSSSVESPLTRTPTTVGTVTPTSPGPLLFASNSNSVAFTRTPTQVLNIVYFSATTKPGGFLPKGATGNSDVTQINGTSTASKTCSSGALSMASFSVASVAALAAAVALVL